MRVNATCLSKQRDANGKIIMYRLKLLPSGQERDVLPDELKTRIKEGRVEVDNLALTTDGRLTDSNKNSTGEDVIAEYQRSCKLLGITPLGIDKIGEDYIVTSIPSGAEVIIPKFCKGIQLKQNIANVEPPTDYSNLPADSKMLGTIANIRSDNTQVMAQLNQLNDLMVGLIRQNQQGLTSIDSKIDTLINEIDNLGVSATEYLDNIVSKITYIYDKEKRYNFPKNKNDIDAFKVYNANSVTGNQVIYEDSCRSNPNAKIRIPYDEQLFKDMEEHLKLVNDIRIQMINVVKTDLESKRINPNFETDARMFNTTTNFFAIVCSTFLHKSVVSIVGSTVATVCLLPRVLTHNTLRGDVARVRHRKDKITQRQTGVFNNDEYLAVDRTKITNDKTNLELYASDIRSYVINTICTFYQKDINERMSGGLKALKNRKKYPWSLYTSGSLVNDENIFDARLFNFYCHYYLRHATLTTDTKYYKDLREMNREQGTKFLNKNQAESNILALETKTELFANAYFAAKKMLSGKDLGFLENNNMYLTSEQIADYADLLKLIKLGLIIQGVTDTYAESMIESYINIDYKDNLDLLPLLYNKL